LQKNAARDKFGHVQLDYQNGKKKTPKSLASNIILKPFCILTRSYVKNLCIEIEEKLCPLQRKDSYTPFDVNNKTKHAIGC
jgi:hypothetical protein